MSKSEPVASVDGALSKLSGIFILAVALCGVGFVLAAEQWPGVEVVANSACSAFDSNCRPTRTEATGSRALALLGVASFALGQTLALISVVGWGVKLGNQATLLRR